jgi:hypothetical protein
MAGGLRDATMADALVLLIAALLIAAAAALVALGLSRHRKRRKARGNADPARDYAPRANWGRSRGALNYSSFVFMDVDGDGKFGEADRPMGGIMVRTFDGTGAFIAAVRTNHGGFANFVMSKKRSRGMFRQPGTYRFCVSVPAGWRVTTGNHDQSMRLDDVPGSPAGLAGEDLPRAVGLSPARFVRGRTESASTFTLLGRGAPLETRQLAPGDFRFDVPEGADTLVISGAGLDRRLALAPYPVDLGLLRPGALAAEAALERVGFDDVTMLPFQKVPCGYAVLDWRNFNALTSMYVNASEGYLNGNLSRGHAVYTSSGHPAEFGSTAPFGFHSVMLTAAWLNAEGEMALVESWLGEELVASDEVALSALAPVQYAPMLKAVTRVRVSTKHSWQAVLDELALTR